MVSGCPKCPCDATHNPLGRSSQDCVQSFRSRVNWCAPFVLGDWEGEHGGRRPFSPIPRPKQQQNPAPASAPAPASVRVESMADGGVGSLRRRCQRHTVLSPEYSPSPARIQSITIKKNGLRPSCAKQNADAQAGTQARPPYPESWDPATPSSTGTRTRTWTGTRCAQPKLDVPPRCRLRRSRHTHNTAQLLAPDAAQQGRWGGDGRSRGENYIK